MKGHDEVLICETIRLDLWKWQGVRHQDTSSGQYKHQACDNRLCTGIDSLWDLGTIWGCVH